MELPAGTLAEVKARIAETEKTLAESQEELKEEEAKAREQKAAADATKEAEARMTAKPAAFSVIGKPTSPVLEANQLGFDDGIQKGIESLEQVKRTLVNAGCRSCAALIVVNAEIRKLGKEVHGHGNAEEQDRRSAGVA